MANASPRRDPKPSSKNTNGARRDPRARFVRGNFGGEDPVVGKDPNYDYILAYKGDADTGAAAKETEGWDYVLHGNDQGTRVKGMRNAEKGKPIELKGHLLMRRPKEDGQREFEDGQAWVDHLEDLMIDRRASTAFPDTMRGQHGPRGQTYFNVQNETKELHSELEADL